MDEINPDLLDMLQKLEKKKVNYIILSESGRKIAYFDIGDLDGFPIFYFHGSPGSHLESFFTDKAAKKYRFRVIALDRPGMGKSDFLRDYNLLDYPDDVIKVANELNIDKFGVMGVSGGATHVYTTSYRFPDKVKFGIDICGWAPINKGNHKKDIAPLDRFFGRIANKMPKLFETPFKYIEKKAKGPPDKFFKFIRSSLSHSDALLVKNPVIQQYLIKDTLESFSLGSKGSAYDAMLLYQDWGFDLRDIHVPILLFFGLDDNFAPVSFQKYKISQLKNCTPMEYPESGHLGLLLKFDEIFKLVQVRN